MTFCTKFAHNFNVILIFKNPKRYFDKFWKELRRAKAILKKNKAVLITIALLFEM